MYLDEFFSYKNQFMEDIVTNDTIVQLIAPGTETENAGSLIYTQIFPYENIPETIEYAATFVCTDVDIVRSPGSTTYDLKMYVWVFSHESLMRLPEGGVRVDRLCHEIAKALDGSHYYGLGSLELVSARRFAPLSEYLGKVLVFEASDWHRPSPTGKPWPSNRKAG